MAFNIPGVPFKLDAQDMGVPDYAAALHKGIQTAYAPQKIKAEVAKLQADAFKGQMWGNLLKSIMGGDGAQGGGGGGGLGGGAYGITPDSIVRGLLHIPLSPEQQVMQGVETSTRSAAQKQNINVANSGAIKEFIETNTSFPKDYSHGLGALSMTSDIAKYNTKGDKAAEKRLIDAGLAYKLMNEYTQHQLNSQGIDATVPSIAHQQEANMLGWGAGTKKLAEHGLPPSINEAINKRYEEMTQQINKMSQGYLGQAGKTNSSYSAPPNNSSQPFSGKNKKISWSDVTHTAEQNGIGTNEVIDMMAKQHKMPPDQFVFQYMEKP